MNRFILSLDQGTTSSRAILFDEDGNIVGMNQKEFKQIFPKPGWVEHNPLEILNSQIDVAKKAVENAKKSINSVEAIGITNQRETTLLWEKDSGKPVYNAIVWQCRRSSIICNELKNRGHSDLVHNKTGLVIDAYFSATKLMWIFKKYPEIYKRAKRGDILFGTVDTWLLYNLTGNHLTDYTNASRTMLFNINTLSWDDDILSITSIPKSILPEVRPSISYFGETKKEIFGKSIPVFGVAGDQQSALFGQGCFEKGMVKNTYGTGCFILMNTGKKPYYSKNGLLTTCAWGINNEVIYALEGSVFVAGAVIQWLRDKLKVINSASETEAIAISLSNNEGVYFVPAFVGLGAPYWNMESRGLISGLTRGAGVEHIVRAALESIAYQSYDIIRCMEKDSGVKLETLMVDGGASANNFLMQYQADTINKRVVRPMDIETTAKGVYFLAGLKAGIFSGMKDILNTIRVDREFQPKMSEEERDMCLLGWKKAVNKLLS